MELIKGDCIEAMQHMETSSVDAIVTDPPYGLEFMGKDWDSLGGNRSSKPGIGDRPTEWVSHRGWNDKRCQNCGHLSHGGSPCVCDNPSFAAADDRMVRMQDWHEAWAVEALRVLKPGGHLLAFGGTRTYHRLACAIEDAGFEIEDSIHWVCGSGFPKSLDVSKAIDKAAGADRAKRDGSGDHEGTVNFGMKNRCPTCDKPYFSANPCVCPRLDRVAVTPEAEQWQGWGTALKPAHEPIIMARKPLVGTVAKNVLEHGTGALNIDATRIEHGEDVDLDAVQQQSALNPLQIGGAKPGSVLPMYKPGGRWPANFILSHADGCEQVGTEEVKGRTINRWSDGAKPFGGGAGHPYEGEDFPADEVGVWACVEGCAVKELDEQSGSSRSMQGTPRKGRNGDGWGMTATGAEYSDAGGASRFFYVAKAPKKERQQGMSDGQTNNHPTVKPIKLMAYLIKMVTPPGGVVLDPFMGSGTTGLASEGFEFIGVERSPDYFAIALQRLLGKEDS